MRGLGMLAAVLLALAPAGCGNDVDDAGAEWPRRDVKIMAPADPGGGWDTTAREMATPTAAPTPCSSRAPISTSMVGARTASSVAAR